MQAMARSLLGEVVEVQSTPVQSAGGKEGRSAAGHSRRMNHHTMQCDEGGRGARGGVDVARGGDEGVEGGGESDSTEEFDDNALLHDHFSDLPGDSAIEEEARRQARLFADAQLPDAQLALLTGRPGGWGGILARMTRRELFSRGLSALSGVAILSGSVRSGLSAKRIAEFKHRNFVQYVQMGHSEREERECGVCVSERDVGVQSKRERSGCTVGSLLCQREA